MTVTRGAPLSDAVRALLARCLPALGVQLAARPQGAEQAAAIIVAAGREADLPPSWQMHDAGRGHRCIVVDELWARSLCAVEHIELCPAFNGALSPGEVWCLVLTPEGGLVVPALLTTGLGQARSRGPAN